MPATPSPAPSRPAPAGPAAPKGGPGADLAALRAEIDALDDAIHDLLMRRVAVVARLAASRAKGNGPALRPGREAVILRRLLSRHAGPLPRAALVRLWRELLWAHTSLQAPLTVAAWLPETGLEALRAHLGLAAPVTRCADAAAALAAATAGETGLAALPLAGGWWRSHAPTRLLVTARLPFLGGDAVPPEAVVFLLSPTPPDPSGDDRTLVRLPEAALLDAGLRATVLAREAGLALAELPGLLAADDPRLAAAGATMLGAYPAPIPA